LAACLLAVSLAGCGSTSETNGRRLGRDLAVAIKNEGRVMCTPYAARELWKCSVETDPGSGWSRLMHLRIGENGCWHARYVGVGGRRGSAAQRSDLSFRGLRPKWRTFRGCTDVEA
jgi:hypothetical protein